MSEYGSDCNLGYDSDLEWQENKTNLIVPDTKEMRSHQKDFTLIKASFNCSLTKIITKEKEFEPLRITVEEEDK